MSGALITVVTSVYNAERYFHESIESILSQSGIDLEFILIDDGSTDGTGPILDDCARRDSRVRVSRQENQGLTRALILGCARARGKYFARHDPDDLSVPTRLARRAALLDADDPGPCVDQIERVLQSGDLTRMGDTCRAAYETSFKWPVVCDKIVARIQDDVNG